MPIYAYRCEACGFEKDVLQKLSDAPLTQCPSCGQPRFVKKLTAAAFQLKGSGWYVTDFREGAKKDGAPITAPAGEPAAAGGAAADAKPAGGADAAPAANGAAPASGGDSGAAKSADKAPTPAVKSDSSPKPAKPGAAS